MRNTYTMSEAALEARRKGAATLKARATQWASIRIPKALKARLNAMRKDGEPIWAAVERAVGKAR